ncbi:hypothetical protein CERSUDRAFT_52804, partial [Gelatoporia subvermispora B]
MYPLDRVSNVLRLLIRCACNNWNLEDVSNADKDADTRTDKGQLISPTNVLIESNAIAVSVIPRAIVAYSHKLSLDDRDILEELRPVDASYRSFLNDEKARLQKGTRGRVLQDIFDWIKDPQQNQRMHVLHGPAGMGKSAILHAVTRQLDNDCLGASFFFNRGDKELSDAHRLFPTLVYQLA